jgi:hypothetical protein
MYLKLSRVKTNRQPVKEFGVFCRGNWVFLLIFVHFCVSYVFVLFFFSRSPTYLWKLLYLTHIWQHFISRPLYIIFFLLLYKTMNQGITKRCLRDVFCLGWPIAPSYISPNAWVVVGGGGGCGFSANEYISAHGAQINFGDLTPYLTHGCDHSLFSTIYILDFYLNPHKKGPFGATM